MNTPIESMVSTPTMDAIFSPAAHVSAMLTFEAALAQAEAHVGVIPQQAAHDIAAQCRVELFDIAALYHEAVSAGTPAIPFVRMLTAKVEGDAQKYVHWGATSQDAIDTALMLQMRDGLDLLNEGLRDIGATCAKLAEQYRHTPMVGRTLLQQALPITFGLKAARWLALVTRQLQALRTRRELSLAVQLGGAAGTLASLGDKGLPVIEQLAIELKLPASEMPWHTERDRIAEIATTLGMVAGAMAKIAQDVVLLAQTEVGEVSEGKAEGKGGSSAMPQKHNPVDAMRAIASSRLAIGVVPVMLSAMTQEHERAVGGWQAEWTALPDLFRFTSGAVEGVRGSLTGLQVDAARMRANLDMTGGLVMAEALTMALAQHVGRPEAYRLVQAASARTAQSGKDFHQVVMEDTQICTVLSKEELDRVWNPMQYLGSTDAFIDAALAAYRV